MFQKNDRVRFIGEGELYWARGTIIEIYNEFVKVDFDHWYPRREINVELLESIPKEEDKEVHL